MELNREKNIPSFAGDRCIEVRTEHGDITLVTVLIDRVDVESANRLKSDLVDLINQGLKNFVIDLSGVRFMDSSGLGTFVSLAKTVQNRGQICFCTLQEQLVKLFSLTKMDKVFNVCLSMDEGIELLKSFRKS